MLEACSLDAAVGRDRRSTPCPSQGVCRKASLHCPCSPLHRVPQRARADQLPSACTRRSVALICRRMQAKNQRNGAVVLGALLSVILWAFTLPTDIRRTPVCISPEDIALSTNGCVEASTLWGRVLDHYESCGSGDGQAPCVQLDLSIDPRSQEAFFATLSQLTGQE